MMRLRRPTDQLAGCCWLPRFADKGRAYMAGKLPLVYRLAFGSPLGVDGCFLRHFALDRRQFLEGLVSSPDDESFAQWFLAQPAVTPASIERWNRFAPRLGAKGSPGYVTRHLVKWAFYPRSIMTPVGSLFEAIEQDERQ